MERVEFGIYSVLCDVDATRRAYAEIAAGAPELCGCLGCQNFAAVRAQVYPADFLGLLDQLGVDYQKESEVYIAAPCGDNLYHYEGWFHFVGYVEQRLDAWEQINEHFRLWFSSSSSLLPDPLKGQPVGQLEFMHRSAPWVLDTQPRFERLSP